jgi:hypothetical protein
MERRFSEGCEQLIREAVASVTAIAGLAADEAAAIELILRHCPGRGRLSGERVKRRRWANNAAADIPARDQTS